MWRTRLNKKLFLDNIILLLKLLTTELDLGNIILKVTYTWIILPSIFISIRTYCIIEIQNILHKLYVYTQYFYYY